MNNDFGSLVMRFANDFHSWLCHSWKLLESRLTREPKIVIHGNSCIILYIIIIIIIILFSFNRRHNTVTEVDVQTTAGKILNQPYCLAQNASEDNPLQRHHYGRDGVSNH